MHPDRKSFFVYVPGARGDFIRHLLYNQQVLLPNPRQHRIWAEVPGVKTHDLKHDYSWWPTAFKWPECANLYITHWINIPADSVESVAWLNLVKNEPPEHHVIDRYLQFCALTEDLQQIMQSYHSFYDHVIDFVDLWNTDRVCQLTEVIANRALSNDVRDRIQLNIDENLALLELNPWKKKYRQCD